jgi:hypothetical protein
VWGPGGSRLGVLTQTTRSISKQMPNWADIYFPFLLPAACSDQYKIQLLNTGNLFCQSPAFLRTSEQVLTMVYKLCVCVCVCV